MSFAKQDISEFEEGAKIECMSGRYIVLKHEFKVNSKRKRYDELSVIKNLDTNVEIKCTWHINRNFTRIEE